MTAAAIALSLLNACAPEIAVQPISHAPSPAYTNLEQEGKGWWRIYFRIARDPEEEPKWHVDVLLADQAMAPVIAHAEPRISLWRFHRRAAPDEYGHRFSFLFYSDSETAETVNNGVNRAAVTRRLMDSGIVREVRLAALDEVPVKDVGGTSDAAWPEALQRGWPWFIMGVSQSWLRLIAEVKAARPPPEQASTQELLDYYLEVHEEVSTLWREHGQHAFLHHLNALFGYQLIIIRETNLKRF